MFPLIYGQSPQVVQRVGDRDLVSELPVQLPEGRSGLHRDRHARAIDAGDPVVGSQIHERPPGR